MLYNIVMRDLKLITPTDTVNSAWSLDIDIVNGFPIFVPYERNTQDQRAAVAAYTMLGSIPGMPDIGINWNGLYSGDSETLVTIDNSVKQAIQKYAGVPTDYAKSYTPVYTENNGKIQLSIFQE